MDVLTSEKREKVLIIDDSTYDRSRSKVVELLAWVHDHNLNRSLKGFKLMTLGWSDGVSFLPLDFILCSASDASKRLQGIRKRWTSGAAATNVGWKPWPNPPSIWNPW